MEVSSSDVEAEASDGELRIVTDSPRNRHSRIKKPPDPVDEILIRTLEEQKIDEILEEKASKNNLTTLNVKSIIKEVVSNEHLLALINEDSNKDVGTIFEPKLTRSKVKELFSSTPTPVVKSHPLLVSKQAPSEVQQLISNEFTEDSSGDEYVPGEEESEDDRDSSVLSETDLRSVSPVTPVREPGDSPVHWTDDGVFKIPPSKGKTIKNSVTIDDAPALRTRSKQSLSDVALETLESSFFPPDITPDMYEMECDNELWSEFLRMLSTKPLDDVTGVVEDDEHDPSYNILADEEINMRAIELAEYEFGVQEKYPLQVSSIDHFGRVRMCFC